MQAIINLVATRQKAGTPAELLRSYNDHANFLMRFEDLTSATLYRCAGAPSADTAPDYLCLYRFPGLAAFADFEVSAPSTWWRVDGRASQAPVSHYQWRISATTVSGQQQAIVLASLGGLAVPDTWPTWWENRQNSKPMRTLRPSARHNHCTLTGCLTTTVPLGALS